MEQILLDKVFDSVKDVLYFFGSFFLSLFPMWHPRAREVPVNVRGDEVVPNDNINGRDQEPEEEH